MRYMRKRQGRRPCNRRTEAYKKVTQKCWQVLNPYRQQGRMFRNRTSGKRQAYRARERTTKAARARALNQDSEVIAHSGIVELKKTARYTRDTREGGISIQAYMAQGRRT